MLGVCFRELARLLETILQIAEKHYIKRIANVPSDMNSIGTKKAAEIVSPDNVENNSKATNAIVNR